MATSRVREKVERSGRVIRRSVYRRMEPIAGRKIPVCREVQVDDSGTAVIDIQGFALVVHFDEGGAETSGQGGELLADGELDDELGKIDDRAIVKRIEAAAREIAATACYRPAIGMRDHEQLALDLERYLEALDATMGVR